MAELLADIGRARDAVAREAWVEGYEGFRSIDPSLLTPPDLDAFADTAWWLSKMDESLNLRQKAYAAYAEVGDDLKAAFTAGRLSIEHFQRDEPAVGAGWLMRAHRHLDGQPVSLEHGYLAMLEATVALFGGELEGAMSLTERAAEFGRRFGDPDLIAMATQLMGHALIAADRVPAGIALLDEAMTAVVAGQLSSYFTGVIYCAVIGACLELADVRRAGQWSDAARVWCESIPPESPYPGMCRINRAEVARLQGAWLEAEAEATRASEELMGFNPMAAAHAFYETGEIRRRIGNLAGAEEAFARAHEIGLEPQPGLALLRAAQGKVEAAATALRLALAGVSESRLHRARLLAAQVEVALAVSDLATANAASDELDAIAHAHATPVLDAMAATARGAVRHAHDDIPRALESLRHACATWQELRLPYETARARLQYGIALRSAGDEEDALFELRAALSSFERLGAAPDRDQAARLLETTAALPRGLTAREAEVLRLVAAGKTNREIAADLVISEHTVARHLQNMFTKLDVSSRSAATAFAFEHGLA